MKKIRFAFFVPFVIRFVFFVLNEFGRSFFLVVRQFDLKFLVPFAIRLVSFVLNEFGRSFSCSATV
jgi:hypothetical protein